MALDQSQEHCVKYLKVGSGTKGHYGQQSEQEMIKLSRSEVMRLLDEFESSISNEKDESKHSDSFFILLGNIRQHIIFLSPVPNLSQKLPLHVEFTYYFPIPTSR